ncbi:MAG: phytanoyl-CoA dioxygenase family protein [Candidatus Latescibacterota bacterium]|nr:phytanoyl-CoA dioxygenase family protein [Candidatus Latescibacterota bacterium]
MTPEEEFVVDLNGYILLKAVLSTAEVAELNEAIDAGHREGSPSLWGDPFKKLIDHPKIMPYLLDLLGPNVRLDHDYAIFMNRGDRLGGLHGGEDGGPSLSECDHWYKYRDGVIRNGLCVFTYLLADAGPGDGGFACIPGSHKSNFVDNIPAEVRRHEEGRDYVVQPEAQAGDVIFFTEALVHGTIPWNADHERRALLYKYSPGHSAWNGNYYDIEQYGDLTERQRRMLLPPSIGRRPSVAELTE